MLVGLSLLLEIFIMLYFVGSQTLFYAKAIGLSPRWQGKKLMLPVAGTTLLLALLQFASINFPPFRFGAYLILVVLLLYPLLFMGGKRKERVLYGFISIALMLFSILFTTNILFPQRLILNMALVTPQFILLMLGVLLAINSLLLLLVSHLTTEGKHYIPQKYWSAIALCFFLLCAGLLAVYQFTAVLWSTQILNLYLTFFSVGLFAIWLLMYFIFYLSCRYFTKTAEAAALETQKELMEQYFLQKQASDEAMQILRHDLKHSLVEWKQLAEEKGETDALATIKEYETQLQNSAFLTVGNESANAILNQTKWQADKAGVAFLLEGTLHPGLLVKKTDLCSLLGNLLDNALWAASQQETPPNLRRILFKIQRQGSLLLLTVENGYGLPPLMENGLFISGKRVGKTPGTGTRSLQATAAQYGGLASFSYADNWFTASIMVQGYKTDISSEN